MLAHALLNLFVDEQCPRRKYLMPGTRVVERIMVSRDAIFARGCTLQVVFMCYCCTSYPQQCPRLKSRGRGSSNICGRRGASRFRQAGPPHHADFAWVVCEVWRAWRVIGDSFAATGCCAGHGVSAAAVCGTFQMFDLRENYQNMANYQIDFGHATPD